jgi:type VI secretion system protein
MREERLLERIHNLEDKQAQSELKEQVKAVQSVIAYLQKILNTRQGSVLMDPEFGVPDLSSMASRFSTDAPETLDDITSSIVLAVEKYEPRLASPRVRFMEKKEFEISLFLELETELRTPRGNIPLTLKINITPEGRMVLSA